VLPTVARDWQAAVLSMAPLWWALDVSKPTNQLQRITTVCESSLRRHVTKLTAGYDTLKLPPNLQLLLSERMPHLRELIASVPLQSPQPRLQLPPHPVTLELSFTAAADAWVDVSPLLAPLNAAVEAVADLARLETLNLCVPAPLWAAGCSLAPLTRTHQLRNLTLRQDGWDAPPMTDAQVSELRALSQLESVSVDLMDSPLLRRLLAQPHSLRWQRLSGFVTVDEDTAPLLVALPLTALYEPLAMSHCDFLAQMPQLTDLQLSAARTHPPDTARILQAVGNCAQLRGLALYDSEHTAGLYFTSAQLGACLSRLPVLETLELCDATALRTLDFLGQGNLPRTLTELRLSFFQRRLPLSELQHVLPLGELRLLLIIDAFNAPLDAEGRRLFTPPTQSPRLPHLAQFMCAGGRPRNVDEEGREKDEPQGEGEAEADADSADEDDEDEEAEEAKEDDAD